VAGLKEIRRRITSIRNTKQITRAMKLVSAAKLRRAQLAAEGGRDYRLRLERIFKTLMDEVSGELDNPLLRAPSVVKERVVIVYTSDRGLCGGFNANVIKAIQAEENRDGVNCRFVILGRKGVAAANRFGWQIEQRFENLHESPALWPVDEAMRAATKAFLANDATEVVIYYTKFISAMSQRVAREVVLPFTFEASEKLPLRGQADGSDPSSQFAGFDFALPPEQIVARVIPLLIKTKLVQAALEAKASEHAARMTAMDSATTNADDLISRLKLFYNRARQGAITKELLDIVGGAEALK